MLYINYLGYKMIFPAALLLFLTLTGTHLSAQSGSDTNLPPETVIDAQLQDSTQILPDEYKEYNTAAEELPKFDSKSAYPLQDSLQKRVLPPAVVREMKSDEDFWYADYAFEKKKEKEIKKRKSFFELAWVKTILWMIIIGGFATAIIMFLYASNVRLFRKKVTVFTEESGYAETDNIFEINYSERIEKAVQQGDYRLAVRLLFLQMLKSMAGRNIIQYKQDCTNFDYLIQLRGSPYYENFFRLARNYEYSWYGHFPVSRETWQLIKNDFEKTENLLMVK